MYSACLPALWGKGSSKEQGSLLARLSGRKLSPSSSPIARQFSSHMSRVPFKLLPPCWSSEGISSSKSVCEPLRGAAWDSRKLCLPQPQSPLVFTGRTYADFSSWHFSYGGLLFLEASARGPTVGLGPLTPEISLQIFICHTSVWDQPVPGLCPSYQSQCGFFFKSIVVGLPFSSVSGRSE